MIHDEDDRYDGGFTANSGHKTWRLIYHLVYGALSIANLLFMPEVIGAGLTAILGVVIALMWGGVLRPNQYS